MLTLLMAEHIAADMALPLETANEHWPHRRLLD